MLTSAKGFFSPARIKSNGIYFIITVFALAVFFSLWSVWQAQAAVGEVSIADLTARESASSRIKPGGFVNALKFSLSTDAVEYLTSSTFRIIQVSNTANTDFGTNPVAFLFHDVNGNNAYNIGDTLLGFPGMGQTISVGVTTTIDLDADNDPMNGTQAPRVTTTPYILAIAINANAVNGHSFRVEMASGVNTYNVTSTSVVSTGITSGIITIDSAAPAVSTVLPTNALTFVPPDTLAQVTYSETMATVSSTTQGSIFVGGAGDKASVVLKALTGNSALGAPTGANLCSAVTFSNSTTTIGCTHSALTTSTWYSFNINTSTFDIAGNKLDNVASSTFRTGSFSASSNSTPPAVVGSIPTAGAQDFPTNGNLFVEFSKGDSGNMAITGAGSVTSSANISLQTVTNGVASGTNVCTAGCAFTWDATNRRLKINPSSNLTASTNYTLTISGSVSNQGNQMMGMVRNIFFKTGAGTDVTAPTLSSITPADGAVNVVHNTGDILVKFSEDVDPSTVSFATTSVFLFIDSNTNSVLNNSEALDPTLVAIRYDSMQKAVHIGMKQILASNTRYCVQAGTDLADGVGLVFASAGVKCFTTVNAAFTATSPTVVSADADNFKVWVAYDQPVDPTTAATSANYAIESPVGTQLNLSAATLSYRAEANGVEITGVGMVTAQQYKVTVTGVKDLSAGATIVANGTTNIAQGMVQNSATTGGMIGGADKPDFSSTNFATFWQNPQRCASNSFMAGKATRMTCEFAAPAALATGASIILTLPTGFVLTSTTLPTTANSFMNADLNGSGPGVTTISAMVTNTIANTVTLTLAHSGTAMTSGDQLRFELDNVYNPAAAGSYSVSAIVKDASGVKQGATITTAPFTIMAGGGLAISGKVCKGTSTGNTCGGEDSGLQGVKVFLDGMGAGHQEVSTNATGAYSFTALSAGKYSIGIFIDPSVASDIGGGSNFQEITLVAASATAVDFKKSDLSATGKDITFTITGGPASTNMTIFCFAPNNNASSAPVMKKVTTNGSGAASGSLKAQPNTTYQCGVGPYIPFDTMSSGAAPAMPDFSFVPPPPQTAVIVSSDLTLTFALTVASEQIIGTVVDGSATAIPNVFVDARPTGCFDSTTGASKDCRGGFTQSKTDGTFILKATVGTYQLSACAPGMPCTSPDEVSIKGDSGNVATDNNSTADVYVNGTLVTSAAGITVKMVKSSVTISGQVLDENASAMKYAFVNAQKVGASDTCTSFTPLGGNTGSPTDTSGNYTLYVSNGTWRVEAFAGTYGQVSCAIMTVSGGTSLTSQNLQATAANYGTISGTVTKNSSNVQGAQINCYGSAGRNQSVSGADGTYSIKVKAGTYTCDGFVPGAGSLTPATGVVVTGGATATADLSMGNPGT
ncbi:MAG: Ig-like domain-containing protein, partial [Patescibacteria group bacterium]